jgi:hypothetical protein
MKLLKPQPNATSEQDDQRYRNIQAAKTLGTAVTPEDAAWAKGYEKQKTLSVDTSASAATARQLASQTRTETFQRQETGRKELSDKIEGPYLDAAQKADTLRNVVKAAQGGNMVAGSLQPLLATLGVTTMEGVKRINATEIQAVQGAGSLLDSIKGRIGKLAEGQPMDAKLQGDITQLANVLQQGAYGKYVAGHAATTKRYQLTDEQQLPSPGGAPVMGERRTVNGQTGEWDGRGWKAVP